MSVNIRNMQRFPSQFIFRTEFYNRTVLNIFSNLFNHSNAIVSDRLKVLKKISLFPSKTSGAYAAKKLFLSLIYM